MTAPIPARVSGPAQLSQRTDLGQPVRNLPDAKYGENRDFRAQQEAAPLAAGPNRPTPPPPSAMGNGVAQGLNEDPGAVPSSSAAPPPQVTPLSAGTSYPEQHVTTGMQMGAAPPRQEPQFKPGQLSEALRPYAAADDSGVLNDLIWQLTDQGI